jgi:cysteinyl-tRNA synthetase
MLTVNGQKISKSLGYSYLPHELITGSHELLDRGYSPMTVRFFMLQSHYASTLDFSNSALLAAQKGYFKLMNGLRVSRGLQRESNADIKLNEKAVQQINQICDNCYRAMNDDFNTAQAIAHLFNLLKKINSIHTGGLDPGAIDQETFERMQKTYQSFVVDVLGLKEENSANKVGLIESLLKIYGEAKAAKDYDKVDEIRSELKAQGIIIKDMKHGVEWALEE